MSEGKDELYSTIFSALRHGARRKILRILSKRGVSFTELLNELGLTSSHLTYHLDALGELIGKNESIYSLSVFGKAAVDMMHNIEDPPARYLQNDANGSYKYAFAILMTVMVVVSALTMNLVEINAAQDGRLIMQTETIDALTSELNEYETVSKITALLKVNPSIFMVSKYSLTYSYPLDDITPHTPVAVIYVPENNRLLHLDVMLNLPSDQYLPLSVQKGNAYVEESDVIWNTDISISDIVYDIQIMQEGWYTVSLVGPVKLDAYGKPFYHEEGWGDPQIWDATDSIRADVELTLVYNRDDVLFGLKLEV